MVMEFFCTVRGESGISIKDKFNNFQSLFAYNCDNIIAMFNETVSNLQKKENVIVRLYGEILEEGGG